MSSDLQIQGIYALVNQIHGMKYIGSSVNIHSRHYQHVWELRKGIHCNSYLQNAWNKYGEASFELVVLEVVQFENDLISKEQYYLDTNTGIYNLNPIAGKPPAPELQSQECRARAIENIRRASIGRVPSRETRLKFRAARLGKKNSPESNLKRSLSLQGKNTGPHSLERIEKNRQGHLGKTLSAETKEKLRISSTGRKLSPEAVEKSCSKRRGVKRTPEQIERIRAGIVRRFSLARENEFVFGRSD